MSYNTHYNTLTVDKVYYNVCSGNPNMYSKPDSKTDINTNKLYSIDISKLKESNIQRLCSIFGISYHDIINGLSRKYSSPN